MKVVVTGANELITAFQGMGDTAADALRKASLHSLNTFSIRMSEYPPPLDPSAARRKAPGKNRKKKGIGKTTLRVTPTQKVVQVHTAVVAVGRSRQYVRTEKLKRGWLNADPRFELAGSGSLEFTATLHNDTDYASYVQGPQEISTKRGGQAWMHEGYWQTASDIGRELSDFIKERFQLAIKEAVDSKFT